MPLKGVMLSYTDTNTARTVEGKVDRRGLCGDVYLTSTPSGARITDIQIVPSVRQKNLTVKVIPVGLKEKTPYALRVEVRERDKVVQEFASTPFRAGRGSETRSS